MRFLIVAIFAAACARSQPEPAPAPPLTVEAVRAPRDDRVEQISGYVTQVRSGAVLLDSGGPNPIPLQIGDSAKIMLDGQQAAAGAIREGDIIRAAYRVGDSGEPVALQVVANSRSVASRR